MKRPLRFAAVLVAALAIGPFLPLYVQRTLSWSWGAHQNGDSVEWGFKLCSLIDYGSNYSYLRPDQRPALFLALNIALAFVYALVIALVVDRLIARRARRATFE